jgi:hypothetical protein
MGVDELHYLIRSRTIGSVEKNIYRPGGNLAVNDRFFVGSNLVHGFIRFIHHAVFVEMIDKRARDLSILYSIVLFPDHLATTRMRS